MHILIDKNTVNKDDIRNDRYYFLDGAGNYHPVAQNRESYEQDPSKFVKVDAILRSTREGLRNIFTIKESSSEVL